MNDYKNISEVGGKMNAIDRLKMNIYDSYESTYKKLGSNIYRGHLRALSTEIEDAIALFISEILPNCKVFIDPSIYINGKNNRPDILVVNEKNEAIFMIEVKANMGWCRNASGVMNDIIENNLKFAEGNKLKCEFSREESQEIIYRDDVKLFLISFVDGNCSKKKHDLNKKYASERGIYHFSLFSGWYDNLNNCDIDFFQKELLS